MDCIAIKNNLYLILTCLSLQKISEKMKKYIAFLFILFINYSLLAQSEQELIEQKTISGRENSEEAINKPYVILISADGYRYDYTEKYHAKNLTSLSEEGIRAEAMLPSFPSITFPNHYSIITGLYPSHHGIVDNIFYDPQKGYYKIFDKSTVRDGSWYGGLPLWGLAEQQKTLSACLFWVSSESDAGNVRPTYYYNYNDKFTNEQKTDIICQWLQLPEKQRPHFITLYFPEVDKNGHLYGPDATQTENAVLAVDSAIGKLTQKVKALNLPNVNFIFVSDHGMIKVNTEEPLKIPSFIDRKKNEVVNSNTIVRITVKNKSEVKSLFKKLKQLKSKEYTVYLSKRMPKHLHYSSKDNLQGRIGDIILLPKAPKIFVDEGKKITPGKHGYDVSETPEMKAVFYAWGPAFKQHTKINAFENVNIYPLIAHILKLKISQPIDGKFNVLKNILKDEK